MNNVIKGLILTSFMSVEATIIDDIKAVIADNTSNPTTELEQFKGNFATCISEVGDLELINELDLLLEQLDLIKGDSDLNVNNVITDYSASSEADCRSKIELSKENEETKLVLMNKAKKINDFIFLAKEFVEFENKDNFPKNKEDVENLLKPIVKAIGEESYNNLVKDIDDKILDSMIKSLIKLVEEDISKSIENKDKSGFIFEIIEGSKKEINDDRSYFFNMIIKKVKQMAIIDVELNDVEDFINKVDELIYKSRRDDYLFNIYLDDKKKLLVNNKKFDDLEDAEKTDLTNKEKLAMDGYKPSLWKGLEGEDLTLLEDKVEGDAKKYQKIINIPVLFGFSDSDAPTSNDDLVNKDQAYDFFNIVMKEIRDNTCVNFSQIKEDNIEKLSETEQYIKLTYADINNVDKFERGCDEVVGMMPVDYRRPQLQPFSELCLKGNDAAKPSGIAHYFMHHLGFDNEHQRPDFATMVEKVKIPQLYGREGMNDTKDEKDSASFLTGNYDIKSVMQWSTKYTKGNLGESLQHMRSGEINVFSKNDFKKINNLYKCEIIKDEDVLCNFIISESNLSVDVPKICLNKLNESNNKAHGNANIFVSNSSNNDDHKIAKVTMIYKTEKPSVIRRRLLDSQEDQELAGQVLNNIFGSTTSSSVESITNSPAEVSTINLQQTGWLEEYEIKDLSAYEMLDNGSMNCDTAKIYDSKTNQFFCSSINAEEEETYKVESDCGEPIKFKYKLTDGDLTHEPILKVNVEYVHCEKHATQLIENNSHFSTNFTLLVLALI